MERKNVVKREIRKFVSGVLACSMLANVCVFGGENVVSNAKEIKIDEESIPNAQIRNIAKSADTNQDGVLSDEEAGKVDYIGIYSETSDISEATAMFPNATEAYVTVGAAKTLTVNSDKIKKLRIVGENVVAVKGASPTVITVTVTKSAKKLDFSKVEGYSKATEFSINGLSWKDDYKVSEVVTPNTAKLKKVGIYYCGISKIDVSKFKNATEISLDGNNLKSINVKKNTKLTSLACYSNKLTSLNISSNKKLKDIGVGYNKLKKLDISKNKKIQKITAYNNKITTIKTNKNKNIKEIDLSSNKMSSINMKLFPNLTYLGCGDNPLKKLSVDTNKKLETLYVENTSIKKLSLKNNKKLVQLNVEKTAIKDLTIPTSCVFNRITVGDKHSILKKVKLAKTNANVVMTVKSYKTYKLAELIPALKGYKFSTAGTDISVTEAGILKTEKLNKSQWYYILANNGSKSVSIMIHL